jgi:hypothetical protein
MIRMSNNYLLFEFAGGFTNFKPFFGYRLAWRYTFAFTFQLTLGKVDGFVAFIAGVRPIEFV